MSSSMRKTFSARSDSYVFDDFLLVPAACDPAVNASANLSFRLPFKVAPWGRSLNHRLINSIAPGGLGEELEGPTALFSKIRLSAYRLDCLGVGVILICDPKPAG